MFLERGCYGCHTIGLLGTPTGPDLSDIGARRSRAELADWIADPHAHDRVANMPTIALTADEVGWLATYLASLHEGQATGGKLTEP